MALNVGCCRTRQQTIGHCMADTCSSHFSPLPRHKLLLLSTNSTKIKQQLLSLQEIEERLQTPMGKGVTVMLWWVVLVIMCWAVGVVLGHLEEGGRGQESEGGDHELFLMHDSKRMVKTDAGEMRVVRGAAGRSIVEKPMHIGFITMEPKSLFIPQYLDSSLILFIRRGEAKVGSIYKDELVEKQLKIGDLYTIPAGSAFYLVNTGEGQRLHIICSIDMSESLKMDTFQSFFLGGGTYPTSILTGFAPETLSTAFNISISELEEIMTRQEGGPIIFIRDSQQPSTWAKFLEMKSQDKVKHLKRIGGFDDETEQKHETWSWRKLLNFVIGKENKKQPVEPTKPYNLYERKPDFQNGYGWSVALDESDYSALASSGVGIYSVNLTAGSMMAPHLNPTATEIGIVLKGSGTVKIVFPNGTSAMDAKVREGDVFFVPRYFPFCQIASRTGPFEFFGFTTSARRNRPQFLAGANSLLKNMRGSEFAMAFGVSEDKYDQIVNSQREAVILPSPDVSPPDERKKETERERERVPKWIKEFGNDATVLGFD